jgi:RNA polymerase sigma-70 factor (ECF subfamily)
MAATAPAPGSVDVAAARVSDLHALYGDSIYRYCRKRLRSHEDAEDAAQIVFLNAHRALAQGVEPRSDSAWLFKIAENVVLYRHRTSVRRARLEYPTDTADLHEVGQPVPETPGIARDLAEALSRVPPSQQRAFVMREWQGLPYQAIATELEVSVEAATALVVRARNNLSRELERPSRLRRIGGAGITWLVAPIERIVSSGVVIKTAAGVATVVIGLPAATAVMEHHSRVPSQPVSSQTAVVHAGNSNGVAASSGGTTWHGGSAGAPTTRVRGAHVRVARTADLGGTVDGAIPTPTAAPDAEVTPDATSVDAATAPTSAGVGDSSVSSPGDTGPAIDAAGEGSSGSPSPDQGGTGNPGNPTKRPTLPPKSKGKPPADPGAASSIPHSGDDTNVS